MERPDSILETDWTQLCYFWQLKGDLERWCGWDECKERLVESLEGRMILRAWDEKQMAERALTLLLE